MPTYDDYADFLSDAEKDDRIGDQDFMVSDVVGDTWQSGDPRWKINGVLVTANSAKCNITFSPPPSAAELKAQGATMEAGKKKAIAGQIRMAQKLAEYYGKAFESLKAGDLIRVKTVKNKEGFIRVIAVLPKGQIGTSAPKAADDIPF